VSRDKVGGIHGFISGNSAVSRHHINLGPGGLCGAVFVDEAFLEVLKQKFGKKVWKKMEGQTRHKLLHDEWEHGVKPMFDGRERTWVFKVPFECLDRRFVTRMGAALPRVTLTADDVRTAFDPIVNKIRAMVDEQVAAIRVKKKGKGPKVRKGD
jgi:hypothetical protein